MFAPFKLTFLTCYFYFNFVNAQTKANDACKIKNTSTQSGEQLRYNVYYTFAGAFVHAANVVFSNTLSTLNNIPVYHFKGEGKTNSSYDWFFKVHDIYESYVDTNSMLPLKFSRNISEGKNKLYNQAIFNQENKTVLSTKKLIKTSDCVQDVLSSIYYARNIDYSKYKINDKIYFDMYLDDVIYPIYITYLGKEKIKTKYGTFNTLKFKPKLIEGTIFKGGENMIVYVSDDTKKIPIYIETPIIVGAIRVYFIP